jgi:hypothetical protein
MSPSKNSSVQTHVRVAIETRIHVAVVAGRGDGLGDNDRHDESVNAQHTGHDDRDNVLDDTGWMVDAHVAHAETGTPGPPRRSPAAQNHARGSTNVAAVVFLFVCVIRCCCCCRKFLVFINTSLGSKKELQCGRKHRGFTAKVK